MGGELGLAQGLCLRWWLCTELPMLLIFGTVLSLGVAFCRAYLWSLRWAGTFMLFGCSLLMMGLWLAPASRG